MTENTPMVARGDEYVVFYKGGAFDGQSERRVASAAGGWDKEITTLASVDGIETMLVYNAVTARSVGDQVQVVYLWDAAESDELEALEDRGEL
ncbi:MULTISPECIES: oligoribonuclease [unclassified Salinibacterium]|uniref:oligoribonuclease n=1 Tax=unclassified Salinibacterium TaxID=2632331 RepID=UPI001423B93E|nr:MULTISPECIES: oligoribonuclease [unclassified Salinibacterium]